MGRHPVDRVISHYYERCFNYANCDTYKVYMNELPLEQIEKHMTNYFLLMEKDGEGGPLIFIDDGAAEASCRTLSDKKSISGRQEDTVKMRPQILDVNETLKISINNMNQCVVGIVEQWSDTKRVINEWFPWIDIEGTESYGKRTTSEVLNKEKRHSLRPDILQLLLTLNACDMLLYEAMLLRFDTQMQYVNTKTHDPTVLIKLPPKQTMPSPSNPFVFLHIEKCAGSTLRE